MPTHFIVNFAISCVVVSLVMENNSLDAQKFLHSPRSQQVESRLKDIYEAGKFRPKEPRIDWLSDSSGYVVWQKQEGQEKRIAQGIAVPSGEPLEVEGNILRRIEEGTDLSPAGTHLLHYRNGHLVVHDLDSEKRTQLTDHPEDRDISYTEPHWSPDGTKIVFIETDHTNVRQRPVLVPEDPSYPGVAHHRFARVGETIPTLRVGVVDLEGEKTQWLDLEPPPEGFYLGQVEWAGNSEQILVEKLSRFRERREFLLFSLDGNVHRIYEETNDAWAISSRHINLKLNWLKGGKEFLIVTERDGWRHAYRYARNGEELALLTPGEYDIIERVAIDEANGWFYFYASPDNATQVYLYRVPLDGSGALERITPDDQPGTHEYEFSPDAKWAIHTYSQFNVPPITELIEVEGHHVIRVLEDNRELHAAAQEVIKHPAEFLKIELDSGVSMDAWMMKPTNFDPSKKYPVLFYVYGEPHLQTVQDRWGAAQSDFHRVVADQGYLVVSMDNRGTPAPKGSTWRRSVFGSLGPISTEEQAAGVKKLGEMFPFVDLSRVAIWGWSGGGSNTLNAMFRKPDVYHVGIAVVPKPQPHLYNAWFQEMYMRDREVNAEGYERSAPLNFAEGLQGHLLMVTGSGETNTHIQIIEGLVDKLIELGKTFDYFVYPNRDHGLREGPGSLVHVRMLIIRYLVDHLPPGPN